MHFNKEKTSNRFDCNKILLDLYCQQRRYGWQGCHRWGLCLTRGQMPIRNFGLAFLFVLIYKMKYFYFVGTVPASTLKNHPTTRCARVWQFLIAAGTILLNPERGEFGGWI